MTCPNCGAERRREPPLLRQVRNRADRAHAARRAPDRGHAAVAAGPTAGAASGPPPGPAPAPASPSAWRPPAATPPHRDRRPDAAAGYGRPVRATRAAARRRAPARGPATADLLRDTRRRATADRPAVSARSVPGRARRLARLRIRARRTPTGSRSRASCSVSSVGCLCGVGSVLAIVLGFVARDQIKRSWGRQTGVGHRHRRHRPRVHRDRRSGSSRLIINLVHAVGSTG